MTIDNLAVLAASPHYIITVSLIIIAFAAKALVAYIHHSVERIADGKKAKLVILGNIMREVSKVPNEILIFIYKFESAITSEQKMDIEYFALSEANILTTLYFNNLREPMYILKNDYMHNLHLIEKIFIAKKANNEEQEKIYDAESKQKQADIQNQIEIVNEQCRQESIKLQPSSILKLFGS